MPCEAMVPATVRVIMVEQELEVVNDDDGTLVTVRTTVPTEEPVSEHRCESDATVLARSMTQDSDGTTWTTTEDRVYCAEHFRPGTMHHADGTTSAHPAMAVTDDEP